MFERPGTSWRHPGASQSVPKRPRASRRALGVSQNRPGASRKPAGMPSERFLEASRATRNITLVDAEPSGNLQLSIFVDPKPSNRFQLLPGALESLCEGSRPSPNAFQDFSGACGKPPVPAPATHQNTHRSGSFGSTRCPINQALNVAPGSP